MDVVTLKEAKKYTDSVALNGVAIQYPRVNPTSKRWEVFNSSTGNYIDTGVVAEGKDGVNPVFRAGGAENRTLQVNYPPSPDWTDIYTFPEGGGSINPADLISADPDNTLILDAQQKLKVPAQSPGGGFTPSTAQTAAMNSGVTAEWKGNVDTALSAIDIPESLEDLNNPTVNPFIRANDLPDLTPINQELARLENDKADKADLPNVPALIEAHNTSGTAHADMRQDINDARSIAEGRAQAKVFATFEAMETWLADQANADSLNVGDNLYIIALDVPDYWWDGTQAQELETEKVDLTDYLTETEIENLLAGKVDVATFITYQAAVQTELDRLEDEKMNLVDSPVDGELLVTDADGQAVGSGRNFDTIADIPLVKEYIQQGPNQYPTWYSQSGHHLNLVDTYHIAMTIPGQGTADYTISNKKPLTTNSGQQFRLESYQGPVRIIAEGYGSAYENIEIEWCTLASGGGGIDDINDLVSDEPDNRLEVINDKFFVGGDATIGPDISRVYNEHIDAEKKRIDELQPGDFVVSLEMHEPYGDPGGGSINFEHHVIEFQPYGGVISLSGSTHNVVIRSFGDVYTSVVPIDDIFVDASGDWDNVFYAYVGDPAGHTKRWDNRELLGAIREIDPDAGGRNTFTVVPDYARPLQVIGTTVGTLVTVPNDGFLQVAVGQNVRTDVRINGSTTAAFIIDPAPQNSTSIPTQVKEGDTVMVTISGGTTPQYYELRLFYPRIVWATSDAAQFHTKLIGPPDHDNMESINRITANNGEWKNDIGDGYMLIGSASSSACYGRIFINDEPFDQFYMSAGYLAQKIVQVSKGQTVRYSITAGAISQVTAKFIPPKATAPIALTGVDMVSSTEKGKINLDPVTKEARINGLDPDDLDINTDDLVAKDQGTANAGKLLGIGTDGFVAPVEAEFASGQGSVYREFDLTDQLDGTKTTFDIDPTISPMSILALYYAGQRLVVNKNYTLDMDAKTITTLLSTPPDALEGRSLILVEASRGAVGPRFQSITVPGGNHTVPLDISQYDTFYLQKSTNGGNTTTIPNFVDSADAPLGKEITFIFQVVSTGGGVAGNTTGVVWGSEFFGRAIPGIGMGEPIGIRLIKVANGRWVRMAFAWSA